MFWDILRPLSSHDWHWQNGVKEIAKVSKRRQPLEATTYEYPKSLHGCWFGSRAHWSACCTSFQLVMWTLQPSSEPSNDQSSDTVTAANWSGYLVSGKEPGANLSERMHSREIPKRLADLTTKTATPMSIEGIEMGHHWNWVVLLPHSIFYVDRDASIALIMRARHVGHVYNIVSVWCVVVPCSSMSTQAILCLATSVSRQTSSQIHIP